MRATLRRSCNACAKAKHGCDLRTPRCSRCVKKNWDCIYANEPLTSSLEDPDSHPLSGSLTVSISAVNITTKGPASMTTRDKIASLELIESKPVLVKPVDALLDPFDTYPPIRLARTHVQRLIYHFLSHIAFQYYPLDLSMESNPFVVSWWPLALADPALFHVSLQTASLDEELRAQKGFPVSESLMLDSLMLLRQRIEDPSSAFQDETLDAVVTLAAIEHGKGNIEISRMHIDGIKQIVDSRGGINALKRTSPLTARMIAWVSLLVTGAPQFQVQDEIGLGIGIAPIMQWNLASMERDTQQWTTIHGDDIDPSILDILTRLRNILYHPSLSILSNTDLHDLTCHVIHKLLLPIQMSSGATSVSALSYCLRYTMVLYMLNIHGTTYYTHTALVNAIILQLRPYLEALAEKGSLQSSLGIWLLSVCLQATIGTPYRQWFIHQACASSMALDLRTWGDVLTHLRAILWIETDLQEQDPIRRKWEDILKLLMD